MEHTEDKSKLVVEYGDERELVEALRPVLAKHGYVLTPERPAVDKEGDRAAVRRELDALNRLFKIARSDTHQSKRVADFLLAWWNADRDGGFDLTSLWNLDTAICEDLTIVFKFIAKSRSYPDALGYDAAIRDLVKQWRQPDERRKLHEGRGK